MSAEATQFDGKRLADTPPEVWMEIRLELLAEWASQINERERRLDREPDNSPGEPAGSRQPRVEPHLGRHRPRK